MRLASASADCSLRLWDLQSGGAALAVLEGHRAKVSAVASVRAAVGGPTWLVSGALDTTLRLWDERGRPLERPCHVLEHGCGVLCVAWFVPRRALSRRDSDGGGGDGRGGGGGGHASAVCALSGGEDGVLRVWRLSEPLSEASSGAAELRGHTDRVDALTTCTCPAAASSRALVLAVSGSADKTVRAPHLAPPPPL